MREKLCIQYAQLHGQMILHNGPTQDVKINIDMSSLKWKSTTHEPCLYQQLFLPGAKHDQLLNMQTEDKLVALKQDCDEFMKIVAEFQKKFHLETDGTLVAAFKMGLRLNRL